MDNIYQQYLKSREGQHIPSTIEQKKAEAREEMLVNAASAAKRQAQDGEVISRELAALGISEEKIKEIHDDTTALLKKTADAIQVAQAGKAVPEAATAQPQVEKAIQKAPESPFRQDVNKALERWKASLTPIAETPSSESWKQASAQEIIRVLNTIQNNPINSGREYVIELQMPQSDGQVGSIRGNNTSDGIAAQSFFLEEVFNKLPVKNLKVAEIPVLSMEKRIPGEAIAKIRIRVDDVDLSEPKPKPNQETAENPNRKFAEETLKRIEQTENLTLDEIRQLLGSLADLGYAFMGRGNQLAYRPVAKMLEAVNQLDQHRFAGNLSRAKLEFIVANGMASGYNSTQNNEVPFIDNTASRVNDLFDKELTSRYKLRQKVAQALLQRMPQASTQRA